MHIQEENLILVVDDTPANLKVISEILTEAGFEVATAIDGERALKLVQYSLPCLIVLDIMMPGIDGFETCKRLKENPVTCEIPVIFMTAISDTENKVKGFSLGAVDYITKPFQEEEVLARIKTHTKLYSLTRNLENQVKERTAQLSKALQDLQESEVKLIQGEKMSILGEVVAGIAHEINNPVNFIQGNLIYASEYVRNMLELVQLYQQEFPNSSQKIKQLTEAIDLDFITQDYTKVINSMLGGTERITQVVKSLRNFSRLDESEQKKVDIHQGIDSTLMILKQRLLTTDKHPEIKVIKEYGQLPLVECYPSQLNQALMNIISNAIDALEEGVGNLASSLEMKESSYVVRQSDLAEPVLSKGSSPLGLLLAKPQFFPEGNTQTYRSLTPSRSDSFVHSSSFPTPQILLRTELLDDNWVVITIADNGPGMNEQIHSKLFDPFFTTKPVGKGIGIGLSVSYQIIVKKHGGQIMCISAPEQGAKFIIKIPVSSFF